MALSRHVLVALLFADDIQFLLMSVPHLCQMLSVLEVWCNESGMWINISKCRAIRPMFVNLTFFLQGKQILVVNTYKYLGLPMIQKGVNWPAYVDKVVAKSSGILQKLESECGSADAP
ncbi:hypothetical protein FBU31_002709, partial [Coemansia sp. 'formosensis']